MSSGRMKNLSGFYLSLKNRKYSKFTPTRGKFAGSLYVISIQKNFQNFLRTGTRHDLFRGLIFPCDHITAGFADGREDFTCDPFSEFPCVWFGTSEDSIVKTGFIDDDDFSSTTHRIRGLSFANFIFIQSCGHSVCFGIPQYLRDILCHEPWFTVFHQNTDFGSVEVEDFRRFKRSSIYGGTVCDTPSQERVFSGIQ